MVSSMRHWALALRVVEPSDRNRNYTPTWFGEQLFADDGWDPFLEDPNTIWLLQWKLTHDLEASITPALWWWAFNTYDASIFSRNHLERVLKDMLTLHGIKVPGALRRDIQVFMQSYVGSLKPGVIKDDTLDCPLTELKLIRTLNALSDEGDFFQFLDGDHESLSDEVFAYALTEYVCRSATADNAPFTVPLEEMLFGLGSPGRVFRFSESGLVRRLERIQTLTPSLQFDETAGLKQLLVDGTKQHEKDNLLRKHYES